MKKAALLPLFFIGSAYGQTLTQVYNEPKPGEFEYVFTVDTSDFQTSIPAHAGNNMTWDLQLLKTSPASETVEYLDSASVPQSTVYPGCDFVMSRSIYNSYFHSNLNQGKTELLGLSSNTLTLHFTDPAVIIEYPASFGDASSDLVSGNFDAGIITGLCAGTAQTIVDGRGTLRLPAGRTYNDVLRVKTLLHINLTAGILPVGSIEQTVIMFYHHSNKFPMLSLSYTKIQVIGGPANIATEHTINALKPTGIEELSPGEFSTVFLFPNPSSDFIHINIPPGFPGIIHADVFNTNGRLVGATSTPNIDIHTLETGLYLVVMKLTDGTVTTRKLYKF